MRDWMKNTDWRYFFGAFAVCAIIAGVLAAWVQVNFWLVFVIAVVGMLLNGRIAVWEDDQPGGFNNPDPDKPDDSTRPH